MSSVLPVCCSCSACEGFVGAGVQFDMEPEAPAGNLVPTCNRGDDSLDEEDLEFEACPTFPLSVVSTTTNSPKLEIA